MSDVGQRERPVQDRVVLLFTGKLGYRYLGNRQYCSGNSNIEQEELRTWLRGRGTSETLINRALHRLTQAAALGEGRTLYEANREVYGLLRYGVKVREAAGEPNQTVRLVDWERPENNDFAVAEEVTAFGNVTRRPDVVLYVNGIAVGVLELKRSTVSVGEGIRQNLGNQKRGVIGPFFSTAQLVMAGNDTEGLRYGAVETTEKYYLRWREEGEEPNLLDRHLMQLCSKERLLKIVHDFTVFDSGTRKVCRHNQYSGLVELLVERGRPALNELPEGIRKDEEAMSETIENNIRRVIIDEQSVNPKYYDKMSELLDALIQQRKEEALDYEVHLDRLVQLAGRVHEPSEAGGYPTSMDTPAKRALYDNLDHDENVAVRVDTAVRHTRKDDWKGHRFKEREVFNAVHEELGEYETRADEIFEIVKNQRDY